MVATKKPRIHRWSYSLWTGMQKCPKSVKLGKIDKIATPLVDTNAMDRGTRIHHLAEQFLKGNITGMPKELSKLGKEYRALKKAKPEHIEEFMSLGRNFKRVKDGFRDGWFTLKADAMLKPRKGIAISIDHKTGRFYPSHQEQAELSAIVQMKFYPDADMYESEFFYVDSGEVVPYIFKPKYLKKREEFWMAEGEKIMAETKFMPTPSQDACKWCAYRSDKLIARDTYGPCRDWMRTRR
jgi:hypothetical protein